VTLESNSINEMEEFTYLGSIVSTTRTAGGTD